MSDVLDEILVQDVAANCPQEFITYQKCLHSTKGNYQECRPKQETLANCIRTNVPSMQRILQNCNDLMQKYENCIRDNVRDRTINQNCMGLLAQLRNCAESQVDKTMRPINEMKLRQISKE